jgi:hypothetical protein
VPPNLAPDTVTCALFQEQVTADCMRLVPPPDTWTSRLTYVGTYEPFLYVPPGLAIRLAHTRVQGILFGRAAIALVTIPLLALAVACLMAGRPAVGVAGLLLAATPVTVFLASALSPAGTEVAASLCLGAAVVRLAHAERRPVLGWAAAACAGPVLALSRSLGPYLVVANAVAFVLLAGPRAARRVVRSGRRLAAVALGLSLAGIAANVAWGILVQPKPAVHLGTAAHDLWPQIQHLPTVYREAVAVFGWQDVPAPSFVWWLWGILLLGLFAVAFVVGRPRQRLALAALAAGGLAGTLIVAVLVINPTHFPMFGRYSLVVTGLAPLYAGDVIASEWDRTRSLVARILFPAVATGVALAHGLSFAANARRYAVGLDGPVAFLGQSRWHPPGSWVPWFLLAGLALAGFVAAGASERLLRRSPPPRPVPESSLT